MGENGFLRIDENMPAFRLELIETKWLLWQSISNILNQFSLVREKIDIVFGRKKINFVVSRWYGRTGNIIQQILIAIAHSEKFKGSFQLEEGFLREGDLGEMFSPIQTFPQNVKCRAIVGESFFASLSSVFCRIPLGGCTLLPEILQGSIPC